jgi:hypothetical protein
MKPALVEPSIKYILNSELKTSRYHKFLENSFLFNLTLFILFCFIFLFIAWLFYKGNQDPNLKKERERKKKEYIMSKLHTYQKMKQEAYTNIPM